MTYYLTEQKINYSNKKIILLKGEQVKMIEDKELAIVERKDGERFHVKREFLTTKL